MAEMGFPLHWCQRALAETGDNIEGALNWILSNGELLSEDEEDQEEEEEEEEVKKEGGDQEEAGDSVGDGGD
ncbi:unnamed protein product, partial [Discosporangium mesarthrocarpum]